MVGFVLIAGLIFAGKSMSVTVITSAVAMAIFFVAGVRLRYLAAIGFLGLAGIGFIAINSPERVERFTTFRNPEVYKQTGGYQLWNGQLALGSGGMKGLGFTNSRMKNAYLPEAHTDFILAVVGEELGYLSLLFVALGYMLFLGLALYIAHHAKDTAGMIIASGVGFAITGHAFVNMGVISGFGPTTGVTAPFLSYGGSSMISALIAIGLLWSISRSSEKDFDEQNLKGSHATHLGH